MEIITYFILQTLFIFLSLIIGVPGTNKQDIFVNKIILFSGMFLFNVIIKIISNINSNCTTPLNKILIYSLSSSLVSVIGYSLFIDLSITSYTRDLFINLIQSPYKMSLAISLLISILTLLYNIMYNMFEYNKCYQEELY